MGLDSIDLYIARRQLRWAGHVARMDYAARLPRRMLSSWVPERRPTGAPSMTYGRSLYKAMDKFNLDSERWQELAQKRGAWRAMLKAGVAPAEYWPRPPPPPTPSPEPLARTKPARGCTRATIAAIDESLRRERLPLSDVSNAV